MAQKEWSFSVQRDFHSLCKNYYRSRKILVKCWFHQFHQKPDKNSHLLHQLHQIPLPEAFSEPELIVIVKQSDCN